ncbi:hydrogenase expression/formation protein HupK [uncultured Roseovarius sp.]|uniref:hydrogenase expression/formation protein HupK n=1 Tax=uncultured Roseovarius sp. TaxID=293344 RepID=UPI00262786E2|nr:hydrogenase expression/formation protein HupK [uncultured Roseovarius sp.]
MLDRTEHGFGGLVPEPSAPLPVADLIVGQSVEDAAALLPRIFNLCRTAQQTTARLAFGLRVEAKARDALHREILRDHLIKFHLKWPGFFGRAPLALPQDWATGGAGVRSDLFGPSGRMPRDMDAFDDFLGAGHGIAPVLSLIDHSFEPGEGATPALSLTDATTVFVPQAQENSVAGRHAGHPVMQAIAAAKGRGPLWRALGRAYDLEVCLSGTLPAWQTPAMGHAIVPAARGTYAIRAEISDGIVTTFQRVTPTDHLLAEGGILAHTLRTLPDRKSGYAALIMDILDPCSPVRLREVDHA